MVRLLALAAMLLAMTPALPARAQDECILCGASGSTQSAGERPLQIEITTNLAFSRLALTGKGEPTVNIDPATGQRRTSSGIVPLGGMSFQGRARITGEPGRAVRIVMPRVIRMSSSSGGSAELSQIETDLPPWPALDANGVLEFSFGGEMRVEGGAGGVLRGQIPNTVDYN